MSANGNGHAKKPPMRMRRIYVQYLYERRCRNNPSFDRFTDLPDLDQSFLLDRMRERHQQQSEPKRSRAK
jgi:hypothetical protein